jgi:uncharacterized protein with FMN-binding domain
VRRVMMAVSVMTAVAALLISLKTAPGASRSPQDVLADDRGSLSSPAPTRTSTDPPPAPAATAEPPPDDGSTAPEPTPERTTAAPRPAGGPVAGQSVFAQYGYVQVAVTVKNGRLVDVVALELPNIEPRSEQLNIRAEPQLRRSALAAQSADIDTVSGATYTSDGYRASLQSALDRAGFDGRN